MLARAAMPMLASMCRWPRRTGAGPQRCRAAGSRPQVEVLAPASTACALKSRPPPTGFVNLGTLQAQCRGHVCSTLRHSGQMNVRLCGPMAARS